MKKLSLLFMFVVLAVALFTVCVFAAQPNIASQAEVSTNSVCWVVKDNLAALTDGNHEKGTGSSHNEGSYNLNLNFSQNMQFEKIVIVVNGKGSTAAGSWTEPTNNDYSLTVKMINTYGDIIYEEVHKTGGKTAIEIFPSVPASQIVLTIGCGWNNQLAIWEVETYGCIAHDCEYKLTSTTTAETCGKDGEGVYTCTICGETKNDAIPATGNHSWDDGITTVAPTESSSGLKVYTCTVCGQTREENLPATGHNWDEGVEVAPTCTEQGYTIFTCTDDGCSATYNSFFIDPVGHSYDDGVVTKHATLTADGEKTFTCTRDNCFVYYTESIPKAAISDSTLILGMDNILSIEEFINGIEHEKRDYAHLFDSNTANSTNSQSNPGGWFAPAGSTLTITFKEEFYVLSFKYYVWSNWNGAKFEFFDANGNPVVTHENYAIQITDGTSATIADCADKPIKSMKVTILSAKGDGTGQCLDFQEFVITAHKHMAEGETARYDEVDPSCFETGSYKKYCYICEKEVIVEDALPFGGHDIISDLSFGRGYDSVGTLQESCQRCDYTKKSYVQPIVSSYGYSVSETGVAGITHKVEINLESLKIYNACVTTPLEFGMVAAATPNFENAPLEIKDGAVQAVNSKIKSKSFANSGYASIEYSISNIQESFYETPIVLCAYVYDGKSLIYINANSNSGEEYETVTINDYRE